MEDQQSGAKESAEKRKCWEEVKEIESQLSVMGDHV